MPGGGLLSSWTRRLLLFVFFLSGASGLIYEIAWMRRLTHVFGSTTLAVSTVLAAFMGGLALGSAWIGRFADRRPERALPLYAKIEASIAVLALLVPLLLRGVGAIYLALAPSLEGSPQVFFLVQFVLVALVLVPPTALMGGTLPLLARFCVARADEVGGRVGALYAANTFGAAAGTALAAYVLLPGIGVFESEVFAAGLNLAAAATAWSLVGKSAGATAHAVSALAAEPAAPAPIGARPGPKAASPPAAGPRSRIAVLLLSTALCGFAAMVYEVAWSRILAMVLGSSVYAFGMMVLVFLAGISLGSTVFVRMRKRAGRAAAVLAAVLTGNTVAGLVAIALVPRLPTLFLIGFPVVRTSFFLVQVLQFLVAAVLLLPSAFFFGMAFPAVIAATSESVEEVGWTVGRVNAANTGGTVAGAFCGGFALIPHFGLRATLMTAATATAVAAFAVLWLARGAASNAPGRLGWRRSLTLASGAALVVAALVPPWPREVLAGGAGFYAASYPSPEDYLANARKMELLFYKDGINTTLSVDRDDGYRYYRSNGKTDASTNPHDLAVQVLLGQIPMLLHPDPRDVFDLGLGTGASAAAVARYPSVRSIEIVDIEPAGKEAVKFFEPENRRILSDPRVHYIAADGRNALLARKKKYDVIICDPSDIWVAGVANLFTREFYEVARSRLNPGGVFVQWWHTHALDPRHMKLVVATFRRVFPEAEYWRPSVGDVIMVGTVEPLSWDYRRLTDRVAKTPGVADDLRGIGLWSPLSLFSAFVLSGEDLKNFVAGENEDHVDDHPVVEYAAPRFLYVDTVSQNEAAVTGFQTKTFPPIAGFDAARDLDAHGVYLLGFGYASLERRDKAIQFMEESTRRDPRNAKYLIGLANQYHGKGQDARAIGAYRRALEVEPGEPEASVDLAAMLRAQGDDAGAEQILRKAVAVSPQDAGAAMAAGQLLFDTDRAAEAIPILSGATSANPRQAGLRLMLGHALAAGGRSLDAVNELRAAVSLAPDDAALLRSAGQAFLAAGDLEQAAAACRRSDTLQPGNPETQQALAEILRRRQTSNGLGIPPAR